MSPSPQKRRRKSWNWVPSSFQLLLLVVFLLVFGQPVMSLLYEGHSKVFPVLCQSNLKQLGLALTQYEQDSDGLQPPVINTGYGWREAVYPFVRSFGVYQCPDNLNTVSSSLSPSYAANHLGRDSRGQERGTFSGPGEAPVNLSRLDHPESTILLADTRGDQNEEWNLVSPAFLPQPDTLCELHVHIPRHLFFERVTGTLNTLMGDGHIKRLKPMNTITPINYWTRDNAPFTGQELSNAKAILRHAEDE